MKQLLIILVLSGLSFACFSEQLTITTNNETEINITRYTSLNPDKRFIWFAGENGYQNSEYKMGQQLSRYGEVWLPELFESHFLAAVPSSLAKIPASDVAALIQSAASEVNQIILIGSGQGILPLLSGLNLWQAANPKNQKLIGVILISPIFFTGTPTPGEKAEFLDITAITNTNIFIIQPKLSPWYWKLKQSIEQLKKGGSDVYLQIIPGIRDRFYYRPDATKVEISHRNLLAKKIISSSRLLFNLPVKVRIATKHQDKNNNTLTQKKENSLKPYRSKTATPDLRLMTLNQQLTDLKDYRGKVVLVNFWASWCPPCVHEMPSMQRLQDSFNIDRFTILGVNMAEDEETINKFISTKVNINFPILLDSDGAALQSWNVFAFPTSYLIDQKGKIRFALFGSIEWDSTDKIQVIQKLINESPE